MAHVRETQVGDALSRLAEGDAFCARSVVAAGTISSRGIELAHDAGLHPDMTTFAHRKQPLVLEVRKRIVLLRRRGNPESNNDRCGQRGRDPVETTHRALARGAMAGSEPTVHSRRMLARRCVQSMPVSLRSTCR